MSDSTDTPRPTRRQIRLHLVDDIIAVAEKDPENWGAIERYMVHRQLVPMWDRAVSDPARAVRFTLALRRYCTLRNMPRLYLHQAQKIPEQACRQAAPDSQMELLLSMGQCAADLDEDNLAMAYYQQVLNHPYQGDADHRAFALNNMAIIHGRREEWDDSLRCLKTAQETWEGPGGNLEGLAVTLSNLGQLLARQGQPAKALGYFEQGLAVVHDKGLPDVEAGLWNQIGSTYDDLGKPQRALEAYQHSVSLHREVGDRQGEASVLSNMALIYSHVGQREQALSLLEQARSIEERLPDVDPRAVLNNIATILSDLGELDRAVSYYKRGLELERRHGDRVGQATVLNNMGLALARGGQHIEARQHYRQALPMWQGSRHLLGLGRTLQNLATSEMELGELPSAVRHLYRAARIQHKIGDLEGLGCTFNDIGLMLHKTAQPERGLQFYSQAAEVHAQTGDPYEEITSRLNCAELLWQVKRAAEARAELRKTIEISRSCGDPDLKYYIKQLSDWTESDNMGN